MYTKCIVSHTYKVIPRVLEAEATACIFYYFFLTALEAAAEDNSPGA
jgi:hypothetical protein